MNLILQSRIVRTGEATFWNFNEKIRLSLHKFAIAEETMCEVFIAIIFVIHDSFQKQETEKQSL